VGTCGSGQGLPPKTRALHPRPKRLATGGPWLHTPHKGGLGRREYQQTREARERQDKTRTRVGSATWPSRVELASRGRPAHPHGTPLSRGPWLWVALSRARRGSAPRDLESVRVCLYSPATWPSESPCTAHAYSQTRCEQGSAWEVSRKCLHAESSCMRASKVEYGGARSIACLMNE